MNPIEAVRALRARPVTVIAALVAAAALTNAALVGCGGGGTTEQVTQTEQPSEAPTPAATGDDAGQMAGEVDGAKIYAERCALCHGATGHGDGPASAALDPKPRNHTDGSYMNARSDEELMDVIRNGKGAMPAWKELLSEEQIEAVLKHVRSLAEPPYKG